MAAIEAIADTLRSVAASGMKPKELLAAVRARHPEASKKEVVRAAFHVLIESHGSDPQQIEQLHDFALAERASEEDTAVKSRKLGKKKHRKQAVSEQTAP